MKIVIMNRHPAGTIGGSELQCDQIARALVDRGHDVLYVALGLNSHPADVDGYRIRHVDRPTYRAIRAVLESERPDVVYWRKNKTGLAQAALAAARTDAAFVYALSHLSDSSLWLKHGSELFRRVRDVSDRVHSPRDLPRLLVFLFDPIWSVLTMLVALPFIDGIVSLNEDYVDRLPVKNQCVIPNSWVPPPMSSHGFEWPKPYVAWVSSLKRVKRPEAFIELASRFARRGIDSVDFLMAGEVQDSRYRFVKDLELPNFSYLGPLEPAAADALIGSCTLLVHTCVPEGFGNVFIQAWSHGKPTVSLSFDPEGAITRERLGKACAGSVDRLEGEVVNLVAAPGERADIGRRARAFSERFHLDANVDLLVDFLCAVRKCTEG